MKSPMYACTVALALAIVVVAERPALCGEAASEITAPRLKEYRIERGLSEQAKGCIDCHADQSKGIVGDWAASRHGSS